MAAPSGIRFAADRMLGRLARLLRLLGYDTRYSPQIGAAELLEIARGAARQVLSRGQAQKRFPNCPSVYSVKSENAPAQLREVVDRFELDTRAGLWTRCTLCNAEIHLVEKIVVESQVAPKIFAMYDEFFRCEGCGHVYWRGSHVERILKNLTQLLVGKAK